MSVKINIGTNKGNLVGIKINKSFKDITIKDISKILNEKYGTQESIAIHGWAKTGRKSKK